MPTIPTIHRNNVESFKSTANKVKLASKDAWKQSLASEIENKKRMLELPITAW